MKVSKKDWNFVDSYFGPLLEYVKDPMITDINYDGEKVRVEHLQNGCYLLPKEISSQITDSFVRQFSTKVANLVSLQLNAYNNVLEAETDDLRISIIDTSATDTGYAISIRKTPASRRMSKESMLSTGYCTEEVHDFLKACIESKMNIVFCGEPGAGKTELLKYLTKFIPNYEKVMTIEDNLEIHYRDINPDSTCISIKVDPEFMTHTKAIKTSLRQNPQWLILSEARSVEVKYILEGLSTGINGLTTLHTDDARKIPDRIQNMMSDAFAASRMENNIYSFVNIGVLLNKKLVESGSIHRYIDQICVFDRVKGENLSNLILDRGKIVSRELPENILNKFNRANGNPLIKGV